MGHDHQSVDDLPEQFFAWSTVPFQTLAPQQRGAMQCSHIRHHVEPPRPGLCDPPVSESEFGGGGVSSFRRWSRGIPLQSNRRILARGTPDVATTDNKLHDLVPHCLGHVRQLVHNCQRLFMHSYPSLSRILMEPSYFQRGCVQYDTGEAWMDHPPVSARILTSRQLQVLGLMSHGLDDWAIATHLGCTPRTVHRSVDRILRALGVGLRCQAIYEGLSHGLISM